MPFFSSFKGGNKTFDSYLRYGPWEGRLPAAQVTFKPPPPTVSCNQAHPQPTVSREERLPAAQVPFKLPFPAKNGFEPPKPPFTPRPLRGAASNRPGHLQASAPTASCSQAHPQPTVPSEERLPATQASFHSPILARNGPSNQGSLQAYGPWEERLPAAQVTSPPDPCEERSKQPRFPSSIQPLTRNCFQPPGFRGCFTFDSCLRYGRGLIASIRFRFWDSFDSTGLGPLKPEKFRMFLLKPRTPGGAGKKASA